MTQNNAAAAPAGASADAQGSAAALARSRAIFALLLALTLVPAFFLAKRHPLVAWIVSLATLLAFAAYLGKALTGSWRGVLIDDRLKISLSRFQMFLWTMLVLSALLTASICDQSRS